MTNNGLTPQLQALDDVAYPIGLMVVAGDRFEPAKIILGRIAHQYRRILDQAACRTSERT